MARAQSSTGTRARRRGYFFFSGAIAAGVFGAAGGALVAVGVPLIVANPAPRDSDVARARSPRLQLEAGPSGVAARGAF